METSICFLNDKILVLNGVPSKAFVTVKGYDCFSLREGSVINGVMTDTYNIKDVLSVIKSDKSLFSSNVSLVIDSSLIHTKLALAPLVDEKNLYNIAKNEFSSLDNQDNDYAFDYTVISPKNKENNGTILCYAVQKSMIKGFLELFEQSKIKLKSIDTSLNCIINYTKSIPVLKDKSYIILYLNASNLSSYMFVNNQYYYSTRARLINEVNSSAYLSEITSQISSMIQFNKAQKNGAEIKEVYISGISNEMVQRLDILTKEIGISAYSASGFKNNIRLKKDAYFDKSDEFIYNIGALIGK